MNWKKLLIIGSILGFLLMAGLCVMAGVAALAYAVYVIGYSGFSYAATGAEPTSNAWIQLAITALAGSGLTLGGVVTTLVTAVAGWFGLKPGAAKNLADTVVDVGEMGNYRRLYMKSTDADEKTKLREAAEIVRDSLFNQWFPQSPTATAATK